MRGKLPKGWDEGIPDFPPDPKGLATRAASGKVLNAIAPKLPTLIGGSADLNPSTFTVLQNLGDFESPQRECSDSQGSAGGGWSYAGRNLHFGVREHGMAASLNGMAAHGGIIPFGSTFLMFSDYMRPAIRLAALMELGVIYVFTHDSIGVGEDGPTHQPIEQLAALRAIPQLVVIRPGDANETAVAWRVAIESRHRPVALALTRQNVPTLDRSQFAAAEGLRRGAYVLADAPNGKPDVVLIGTGSEVGTGRSGTAKVSGAKNSGAHRFHAELGTVRSAAARVSRIGFAFVDSAAARGGSGSAARLASLCRRRRRCHRHRAVRRLGAGKCGDGKARLHRGPRRGTGCEAIGKIEMRIAIGADHAGFALKQKLGDYLRELGHEVTDAGTMSTEPVDYPDYAEAVGKVILDGRAERGVLICGSGVGASVAANKLPGIRAAVCHDTYSARQGVEHDDMNILVLGARIIGEELARELVRAFLAAKFTAEERHLRRVGKIKALEKRYGKSV